MRMGKKNKHDKMKNAIVNIDEDIKINKDKYDGNIVAEEPDVADADGEGKGADATVLSDMMKQYERINKALKNDDSSADDASEDAELPKYSHLDGGILDLDEEPSLGDTVVGVIALGVFVAGVVVVARFGWKVIGKVRQLV